ncbi:hypothetical protein HPP92_007460 [Vanilla planifolia]|uniref:Uncharacterized protein n=1 Tax=Vanilla planifolia TaxID=51239 RepID=A0A835V9M5_VANPL|nr:hypothetical protein HPP92_007643 [Vanilla planifolia]KAG0490597.1 hypothetical protein HPP92_007460 [Vanilla planifolia]
MGYHIAAAHGADNANKEVLHWLDQVRNAEGTDGSLEGATNRPEITRGAGYCGSSAPPFIYGRREPTAPVDVCTFLTSGGYLRWFCSSGVADAAGSPQRQLQGRAVVFEIRWRPLSGRDLQNSRAAPRGAAEVGGWSRVGRWRWFGLGGVKRLIKIVYLEG